MDKDYRPPSWQAPPEPPKQKKRGWSGIDVDGHDKAWWTACCILESINCCWWPLLGLAVIAAVAVTIFC